MIKIIGTQIKSNSSQILYDAKNTMLPFLNKLQVMSISS